MKKFLITTALLLFNYFLFSQQNHWKEIQEADVRQNLFSVHIKPSAYKLFSLDRLSLTRELRQAPSEADTRVTQSPFIITVPDADGKPERFKIVSAPVMEPALAAKYPSIKSYAGVSIDHRGSSIRISMGPDGFHAMILSPDRSTIYIDPLDEKKSYYISFYRKDASPSSEFRCELTATKDRSSNNGAPERAADDGRLRTYRLAVATTGEYSQHFLNGSEPDDAARRTKVLAGINTAMTRVNGVYEKDLGVRMLLIGTNDQIIYLNAGSDPWTNEFNNTTQTTIDNVIGNGNYDIGHLFHKDSDNGNAGCIGCVCTGGSKGSAFTSHTTPAGDPFTIDYVAHEMGHQFGARHSFSFWFESGAAQYEPGSGSTIMGYAGITGSTDVQAHSDDYFHAANIEEITDFIKNGSSGGSCANTTITGNSTPTSNAGSNYTIPKSTPFILTGSGSDADGGDVLTYTWEQMDLASSSQSFPSTSATAGALFRSIPPSTSPSRVFPKMSSILDNTNGNTWEQLPGVARTLNFRFLVRDNHTSAGNNKDDDMSITVDGSSGPFTANTPTGSLHCPSSSSTITWAVNGTNASTVNCSNVNIWLSTDNGYSFPHLLASNTSNDGSETVTLPYMSYSNQCRIKVEAVGNIFFDISPAFTVMSPFTWANIQPVGGVECFEQNTMYYFTITNPVPGLHYKWGYWPPSGPGPVMDPWYTDSENASFVFYNEGYYGIIVIPYGDCGEGTYYEQGIYVNGFFDPCSRRIMPGNKDSLIKKQPESKQKIVVKKQGSNNFRIIPNPAVSDIQVFSMTEAIDRIIIYDVQGKPRKNLSGNRQKWVRINVSDLNSGIYLAEIHSGNTITTEKFIVQH